MGNYLNPGNSGFAEIRRSRYVDKSGYSSELFDDLAIAKDVHYRKYLNKYDVIYLDIK